MKFQIGDATDAALCIALKHEFLRCADAFKEFRSVAIVMIARGESRRAAYAAYNAYTRFAHHLYEFMLGAAARDARDTGELGFNRKDDYIAGHVQRIVSNRRKAILDGTAPAWENDLAYYPEEIPANFASDFRRFRNTTSGHVKFERSSLSPSVFYSNYQKYLHMLYSDAQSWWGRFDEEFPELNEITAFSVVEKDAT